MSKWPTAQNSVARCSELLNEVQDLIPGKDLEARLNAEYSPAENLWGPERFTLITSSPEDDSRREVNLRIASSSGQQPYD